MVCEANVPAAAVALWQQQRPARRVGGTKETDACYRISTRQSMQPPTDAAVNAFGR